MTIAPDVVIAGGSYPDSLHSGEFVALVHGSHLETHVGLLPLPPGEAFGPMFLRCTPWDVDEAGQVVPGFRFCGLAHDAVNRLWEWSLRRAQRGGSLLAGYLALDVAQLAGASPVIYDRRGARVTAPIPLPGGEFSSQGYRYVDEANRVVTGQETYGPESGVSQFTRVGDLLIGQGHARGGVVVSSGGSLRELRRGRIFDIRLDWVDGRVSLACWDADTFTAYVYRTTLEQLRALPPQVTPAPPPSAPPVPLEPPMKKCEVTVDAFTLTPATGIKDGDVARFHDRENANGAHVRVWVENGSMRFSIDYPGAGAGLKGETGARRPVR